MKKHMLSILIAVGAMTGCSDLKPYVIEPTEVEAVFMHTANRYSVVVKEGDSYNVIRLPTEIPTLLVHGNTKSYRCDAIIDNAFGQHEGSCTITITNVNDINGAGWNRGKFGSGMTTRID